MISYIPVIHVVVKKLANISIGTYLGYTRVLTRENRSFEEEPASTCLAHNTRNKGSDKKSIAHFLYAYDGISVFHEHLILQNTFIRKCLFIMVVPHEVWDENKIPTVFCNVEITNMTH
jgi:hypothetical protein